MSKSRQLLFAQTVKYIYLRIKTFYKVCSLKIIPKKKISKSFILLWNKSP